MAVYASSSPETRPTTTGRQIPNGGRQRLTVLGALFAAAAFAPAQADENVAANDSKPPLKLEIDDIKLTNMSGLTAISGQFVLTVSITNETDSEIEIENKQFRLFCNDVERVCNSSVLSPLVPRPRKITAGETVTGAIGVNLSQASTEDPKLVLQWSDGDQTVRSSLNDAFSKVLNLQTRLMGPDNCLAVISISRKVDILASWHLNKEFARLKESGLRRVVLQVKTTPEESMSYSNRMAIYGWLGSIKVGYEQRRFGFNQNVNSKVQFQEFQVVGMGTRDPYGYSQSSARNIYRDNLDEAIAYCLRSLYDQVDIRMALRDMRHEELGVRRVALETNIDRLTHEQLSLLLQEARTMTPEQQALLAANLHRTTFPIGIETLRTFANGEDKAVVKAAIDALVRSVSPNAVVALQDVWQSTDSTELRPHIVQSVLTAQDFRHVDLVEEFAGSLLKQHQHADNDRKSTKKPDTIRTEVSLPAVLSYLKDQERPAIRDAARQAVLKITRYDVQDSIVDFLIRTTTEQDEQMARIVRDYIAQRLRLVFPKDADSNKKEGSTKDVLSEQDKEKLNQQYGPRPGRDARISTTFFNVVKKFPDPEYTSQLLKLSQSSIISSSLKRTAYQSATQCASDDQLEEMIGRFSKLDRYSKEALLRQLSSIHHPKWLPLARQALRSSDSEKRIAVSLLTRQGSYDSMELLADHLSGIARSVNNKAESKRILKKLNKAPREHQLAPFVNTIDIPSQEMRAAQSVITSLRTAALPEVRRAMNRCERSASEELNTAIEESYLAQLRQDMNSPLLRSAIRFRRENDNQSAAAELDKFLTVDPFNVPALTSRASLHLRLDEPALAKTRLQEAIRLSPENADIESLLALTEVRLGNVEKGIQQMLDILKEVPNLETTIRRDAEYNLACVYGRAAELADTPERKTQYIDLGLAAIKASIYRERGFNDPEHVRNDPDLNIFRDHAQWNDILNAITDNEKKSSP